MEEDEINEVIEKAIQNVVGDLLDGRIEWDNQLKLEYDGWAVFGTVVSLSEETNVCVVRLNDSNLLVEVDADLVIECLRKSISS